MIYRIFRCLQLPKIEIVPRAHWLAPYDWLARLAVSALGHFTDGWTMTGDMEKKRETFGVRPSVGLSRIEMGSGWVEWS
jgi:hypothetical protein